MEMETCRSVYKDRHSGPVLDVQGAWLSTVKTARLYLYQDVIIAGDWCRHLAHFKVAKGMACGTEDGSFHCEGR
jgi:hypothetical protein